MGEELERSCLVLASAVGAAGAMECICDVCLVVG